MITEPRELEMYLLHLDIARSRNIPLCKPKPADRINGRLLIQTVANTKIYHSSFI